MWPWGLQLLDSYSTFDDDLDGVCSDASWILPWGAERRPLNGRPAIVRAPEEGTHGGHEGGAEASLALGGPSRDHRLGFALDLQAKGHGYGGLHAELVRQALIDRGALCDGLARHFPITYGGLHAGR